MNTSELWRLSKKVYREIVFQSFFSLRIGGTLPQGGDTEKNIVTLVKNAEMNTMISKIMKAFLIGVTGVFIFFSGVLFEIDVKLAAACRVSTMLSMILL